LQHRKAGPLSLKTLAPYWLSVPAFWEPETGHDDNEYVLKDARYSLQLTEFFIERLKMKSLDFYKRMHLPWTKGLLETEMFGIRLDVQELNKKWAQCKQDEERLQDEIQTQWKEHFIAYYDLQAKTLLHEHEERLERMKIEGRNTEGRIRQANRHLDKKLRNIEPLNLDSPMQLKWLLRERLNLDTTNLDGEDSTDKETLTRLSEENPEVAKLLHYRKAKKLNTTYYPEYLNYVHNNRIHTTFNTIGTRTGRLSASDPNVQQVPGALHDLFTADPGCILITRDLSAIEPVVLAYFSEDPILCDLMITGGDFHSTNARAIFDLDADLPTIKKEFVKERKVAKEVGLSVLYGAGAGRVYQIFNKHGLHDLTFDDAKRFVYRLRDLYKGVWRFKQELDKALETGDTLYNLVGRPITISNAQDVYMTGLNTLIQSSASDLLQHAAYQIRKQYQVLLLVHDEIVVQAQLDQKQAAVALVEHCMKNSFDLKTQYGSIPIKVEGKESLTWEK
jgi:DNA polymerase I-like protein with 3'-5' exonuclease and polymerase domains